MHTCQSFDPSIDLSVSCAGCLADQLNVTSIDSDDIIVWSDGTFCSRDELDQYSFMSDDYEVLSVDSPVYNSFIIALDAGCPSLENSHAPA